MASKLISTSIPNLLNGVSQQPDTIRLPNQAETQENGLSDVVYGLGKRPPSIHVAKLNIDTFTNSKIHFINRDSTERYTVLINNGSIKVYDLSGNQKTVVAPSLTYLTTTNPVQDINLVTVADFTFVVNKTITVAKSGSVTNTRPDEAIFYVKNGQYKTTYEIKIDGSSVASYQTLDNSTSSNASSITTDNIATELYNDLVSAFPSGYTIVRDGSIIYFAKTTGTFTASVSDGIGGDGLILVKNKTNSFSDLPYKGYTGFLVEVTGDKGTEFDNYYVYWDGNAWVETVADGLDNNFNKATLPHVLIRTADGNFRFCKADGTSYTIGATTYTVPTYNGRTCGDEDTASDPSFVGNKIQDIFFYRNRLGLLSDENVIFSKVSEFFTFYPETVTTILDDDAVDVAVSHNRVSNLKWAVALNEELLLFSDTTQFLLKPEETLTSKTVAINQATEYEIDSICKPIPIGKNVYFSFRRGTYAGVSEYFLSSDLLTKEANDTSLNVPRYLNGRVYSLKGSNTENTLFAFSSEARNTIGVYKFYFDSSNKSLQKSWSKYIFPTGTVLLDGEVIDTFFYLVVKRDDGVYLEKINLKTNEVDTNLTFPVLLDRKVSVTGTYNSTTNLTTFTLPYPDSQTRAVVLGGDWSSTQRGRSVDINSSTSTTVVVVGNYSSNPVYIGNKYNFKYRFSTFYVREQRGSGTTSTINTGRLQLKKLKLVYGDTGYFNVTLFPTARNTSVYQFTGQILGSSNFILGKPTLESGSFSCPIQCRNIDIDIEINSNSYLPCNFLSAEWEGLFTILSQRVAV
jgi:hypothetical protein